jgi:hypothetical protein
VQAIEAASQLVSKIRMAIHDLLNIEFTKTNETPY